MEDSLIRGESKYTDYFLHVCLMLWLQTFHIRFNYISAKGNRYSNKEFLPVRLSKGSIQNLRWL